MKKLLSIILALAMILTLVPSVFANGETENDGITIEYSFLSSNYDTTSVAAPHNITYLASGGRMTYDSVNSTATAGTLTHWNSGKPYFNVSKDGDYHVLRIRVPKSGSYSATLSNCVHTTSTASGIADVYLIPCSDEKLSDLLEKEHPLFEGINSKATGTQTNTTIVPTTKVIDHLTAGEYYFVIKRNGEGSCLRIRGLTLTQGTTDTPALIYADVALGKTEIDAGVSEETEIALSNVYMSDGESATDTSAITYTSSDESVAKIENGKVKAVCHGTATISAVVGDYVLGSADVTVINSKASEVSVNYSFKKNDYDSSVAPDLIAYSNSAGRFELSEYTEWAGTFSDWTGSANGAYYNLAKDDHVAFKMRVPESGLYRVDFEYYKRNSGALADIYIIPAGVDSIGTAIDTTTPILENVSFVGNNEKEIRSSCFEAETYGEYYLVFHKKSEEGPIRPIKLTLDGNGTKTPLIYADVSLDKTTLEVAETTTLTKGTPYLSNGNEADATGVTYKSTNEAVATISDTAVTAVAPGTAKIQALRADGYVLDEETVTVNTPEYTEAFGDDTFKTEINVNVDPSVVAVAYAKDATLSQTATAATKNANGTWSIETPEEIDGYTFRYWARGLETGNKRIVSLKNNFTYSPEKGDANYLIAVYANNSEPQAKEYFNANGQLIPDATDKTKPYMLGYGYATDWKDNGNGIMEAVYGNGIQKYEITVNGKTDTCEYGTKITCPTVTPDEGKYFLGWTKKVGEKAAELVSTDMNYTFYAWEDCTVEPLFGNSAPELGKMIARKILISSLAIENGDSVIMAEFIGFDNAVERGITLDKDYAMSNKNATQFTIINDVDVAAANISAYAILADGTKFIYNLK